MLRSLALVTTFALSSLSLAGCHLYFEEEQDEPPLAWPADCRGDDDCDPDRPRDEPSDDEPGTDVPDLPPIPCATDAECQAGCFCSDEGFCEESSLCQLNQDCGDGFTCDEGTCVPRDEVLPCEEQAEAGCLADDTCSPIYRGVNCTSETGEPCSSDAVDCTCESFAFASCEEAE